MKTAMSEAFPVDDLPCELPVLPLREYVVFPHAVLPLAVAREGSVRAMECALEGARMVLLLAQRHPEVEVPGAAELHTVGTVAMILRSHPGGEGPQKLLVQGVGVARVEAFVEGARGLSAQVEHLGAEDASEWSPEVATLVRRVRAQVEELLPLKGLPPEILQVVMHVEAPGRLADIVAANLRLGLEDAQAILETADPVARLRKVDVVVRRAIKETIALAEEQSQPVEAKAAENRDHFLRDQLRAIQEELGSGDDARSEEVQAYRARIEEVAPPAECREEALRQLGRLERMHPDSPEAQVVRNYLDWVVDLPWSASSQDCLALDHASEVLEAEHAHLAHVKERLLEFLSVRKLRGDSRGPILCFAGPPGVGKTSLGRSIAHAMGRKFVRISLGGVRDEAEIRGHRRTYVGAMPGRILQALKSAGVNNPVIMLDEVDKVGADSRGDPSAALLEVLDPEQNAHFTDHFLNVPFDLSKVLFIATANSLDPISPPLRDRMEILSVSGYTPEEKIDIADRFLVPKQEREHGLDRGQLSWSRRALERLVSDYTWEAGVRGLERQVAVVCRKVARKAADGERSPAHVTCRNLARYLGPPIYQRDLISEHDEVGVCRGLAWTAAGGEMLCVEASLTPGEGLLLTGQLGDVMKESGQAALSFVRGLLREIDPGNEILNQSQVHVHVPAGAISKDGPSAGVTLASAILSAATGIALRRDVAMTGELTLRGRVLPVGGIREKALAAARAGVRTVLIPKANAKDLVEIPREIQRKLDIVPVDSMQEVLEAVLVETVAKKLPRPRLGQGAHYGATLSARRS